MRLVLIPAAKLVVVAAVLVLALCRGAWPHEWYTGLEDGRGLPCCDVRDCAPVAEGDYRFTGAGKLEIRISRRWWPVVETSWVQVEPPDGRPHACKLASESFVRCVIWPGQM